MVEGVEAGGVVQQFEHAHGPAQPGFDHLVHLRRAGDAQLHQPDALGDEVVDEAGHEKSGGVLHHHRLFADGGQVGQHGFQGGGIGQLAASHLDQGHYVGGVKPVGAHQPPRPFQLRGQFRDEDGGGVGCDDDAVRRASFRQRQGLLLEIDHLGDGLDDQVRVLQPLGVLRRPFHPGKQCGGLLLAQLAALHRLGQSEGALFDQFQAVIDRLGPAGKQGHLRAAALQAGQGDPVAHQTAAAQNGDALKSVFSAHAAPPFPAL